MSAVLVVDSKLVVGEPVSDGLDWVDLLVKHRVIRVLVVRNLVP